jgi:hypothetical protein
MMAIYHNNGHDRFMSIPFTICRQNRRIVTQFVSTFHERDEALEYKENDKKDKVKNL